MMKQAPKPCRFKSFSLLNLSPLLFIGVFAHAQPTTGFNQPDSGTYDYNNPAYWVEGHINGIWDADLTLAGGQTITFGQNSTLSDGLSLNYNGSQNVTFRSDGTGPYTITLGGDLLVNTVSANRTVTIGSTTANQGLNIDLGEATRTFTVGGAAGNNNIRSLTLHNNVTNGSLTLNGGGHINLNGTANTLSGLRLQNTNLRLTGVSSTDASTTISGALTIDGNSTSGGASIVTLTPHANRNLAITASELVRENNGVVFFRGNNLGGALGANGVSNVTFTTGPDLVGGGGAAGDTNISILAWGVGGTTAAIGSANTFVTYDATNGIRALDLDTEFVVLDSSHEGGIGHTTNNVRTVVGSTVTLTGDNTVNSLIVGDSSAGGTTLAGDGTLSVTSGAVLLQRGTISTNLNFGETEGIIGVTQGQGTAISGSIVGTSGLTIYQPNTNAANFSGGTGVTLSGAATFTGDLTVLGRANVTNVNFLAHGNRTGNVIVNGILEVNGSGTFTMNGLYGTGQFNKGGSSAATVRIGDNNANGHFTGTITQFGAATIEKIGTGTQILGGDSSYTGGTIVSEGTLLITNTQGSGTGAGTVTVASGARFGGTGIASGAVSAHAADSVIIAGGVNAIGNLTLAGGLTANDGVTFAYDINGGAIDTIDFGSSSLSLGGTVTFDFSHLGSVQTGFAYNLFLGTGDWSSVTASFVFNGPEGYALDTTYGDGNGYLFDAANHSFTVQFVGSVIPEPSSYGLLAGAKLLGFALLRRKPRTSRDS